MKEFNDILFYGISPRFRWHSHSFLVLQKFSVLNKLVKDQVPEIGFSGTRNRRQPKNVFLKLKCCWCWTRFYFIFRHISQSLYPLAWSTLKKISNMRKIWQKMKKSLSQLPLKTHFSMELQKPNRVVVGQNLSKNWKKPLIIAHGINFKIM